MACFFLGRSTERGAARLMGNVLNTLAVHNDNILRESRRVAKPCVNVISLSGQNRDPDIHGGAK